MILRDESGTRTQASWQSFEVLHGDGGTPFLLTCDHASNALPPDYGTLGVDPFQLERHIGLDIGAYGVASRLAVLLNATLISSRFCRLLIDPNRGEDDPTLVMQLSGGTVVPGNANIGDAEIAKRIALYYRPYHGAIATGLDVMASRGLVPIVLAIHSFTDVWRGVPRPWHAGVLWDNDPRLAVPLLAELSARTGAPIGDNEPYSGVLEGDALYKHGTSRGLPHALLEIRQDLIETEAGQHAWAEIVAGSMRAIMESPVHAAALSRVEYFGSRSGAPPGRRGRPL